MQARVTMRQVAKEAGVGLATVSRVMSGYPHVTPDAKGRVEAALARLEYRPDPALRAIAACRWQGKRSRAGEVIAWLDFSEKQNAKVSIGLQKAAAREGYRVERFPATKYDSARKLGDVLLNRGINGLVLPNIEETPDLVGMPWERFCTVAHGVSYAHNPVDTVRFNPFETVELGLEKLAGAGATRLGLVLMHGRHGLSGINRKMVAAFDYSVRAKRGRRAVKPLVMPFAPDNSATCARWLDAERPDGVIGLHDGVRLWIESTGRVLPRDGCFLSLRRGDYPGAGAGFRNMGEECALIALEQVMLRLRQNQRGVSRVPMDYVLSPQWVPGYTCPESGAG